MVEKENHPLFIKISSRKEVDFIVFSKMEDNKYIYLCSNNLKNA